MCLQAEALGEDSALSSDVSTVQFGMDLRFSLRLIVSKLVSFLFRRSQEDMCASYNSAVLKPEVADS